MEKNAGTNLTNLQSGNRPGISKKRSTAEIHTVLEGLQEIQGLYENILDSLTCGVWVADENDVIYYANKGMEMIAGVTHQKLEGYNVLTDSSSTTIDYFREHYIEAKQTLRPVYYSEIPVVTPAGKLTYQTGWLIPRITEKRYSGMICVLEDITSQRELRSALRQSETKYRELVQNANSVIMQIDLKGNITFFNKFAQAFFGYNEDELIGKNIVGTIVPPTPFHASQTISMLEEIGSRPNSHANVETENITKGGEQVWIVWTNKAIMDEHGHVSEILCVGNDITQLKNSEEQLKECRNQLQETVDRRTEQLSRANEELHIEIEERKWTEKVLRNSEEKYRLVVENSNEGILITQDGFFKYANPKASKITGFPEKELLLMPFINLVHPDDRDFVMERYLKKLKGDSTSGVYTCRIIDKEGAIKWLEINSVVITWMGRPATLAFFNNVTERKKTAERLRLLESAIQQTNDSIVITTAKPEPFTSKVVFVNQAFTRMTGYASEDVIGRLSVILQGPKTVSTEWFRLESSQNEGKGFYLETADYRKDGSKYNLEWQISPLRDENGKITHFILTLRDITARKKVEQDRIAYQENLRSLASELSLAEERERRRIATNIHDHIGQTLAIAKIKLGEVRSSLPSAEFVAPVDGVRGLLERAIQYTKTLTFELSPPVLYELGFSAAVEWLCETIQKEQGIIVNFEDESTAKPMETDISVLMFQALRELLINAVKHSKATSVRVSISGLNEIIKITVEDRGIGFNPLHLDKTTFGFFSIRERLKYFGGGLAIDSEPGRGTRVTLTAPVKA